MAYEKNKQTPSRTLRYYHVQDYLLRPSCSMRRRARRRPFLLTPQSTAPREPKGINALSMACDQGIDVVSNAHQRKCINFFRSSHNHLPRRPTFFLQMLPSSRDLRRVVSPVMPQRGRYGARTPLHPYPYAFPPPS